MDAEQKLSEHPRIPEVVEAIAKATAEKRITWEVSDAGAYETPLRRYTLRMDDKSLWLAERFGTDLQLLSHDVAPIQEAREAVVGELIDALMKDLRRVGTSGHP